MRLFKRVLSLVITAAMAAGLASCSASPSSVTSDTSQTGATEKLLESYLDIDKNQSKGGSLQMFNPGRSYICQDLNGILNRRSNT